MAFKVGQKVVCINGVDELIEGEIYTVEGLNFDGFTNGLYLFELNVPHPSPFIKKWRYVESRFRSIDYDFVEEVIKQVTPKEVET